MGFDMEKGGSLIKTPGRTSSLSAESGGWRELAKDHCLAVGREEGSRKGHRRSYSPTEM